MCYFEHRWIRVEVYIVNVTSGVCTSRGQAIALSLHFQIHLYCNSLHFCWQEKGTFPTILYCSRSRERHQRKGSEIELEEKSVWDAHGGHSASMSG